MSSDGLQLIVGEVNPRRLGLHRLGRVVDRALAVGAEMAGDLAVSAV